MAEKEGGWNYLWVTPAAGLDNIKRLGLGVETKDPGGKWSNDELLGLVRAYHLPFSFRGEGVRTNIAARDDAFRKKSLDYLWAAVPEAARLGAKKVIMHAAPRLWKGKEVGVYERLIEALKDFADFCAGFHLQVVLENNLRYWREADAGLPPENIDQATMDVYFATFPEEWQRIAYEVDKGNFLLCLDTSHATSCAVGLKKEEREEFLYSYLKEPELISHIHWSDNFPWDKRGRNDSHRPVGDGQLPQEFHRRIKELPTTKTLEFVAGPFENIKRARRYIESL